MVYIIFYKVHNTFGYNRNTFNGMSGDEVFNAISKLYEDEYHIFENTFGWNGNYPNLSDLQEMYNDEEFDNSAWWCIVVQK